jgi:catechol 2,3-dioxygenase-like lactoylglutathione lyase family enzyme
MDSLGAPPKSGWASFVPELLVQDIGPSLAFWRDILGFAIAYQRPAERFVYLERPEGSQVMLSQRSGTWETAALERPFGRGVMFQLTIASIKPVLEAASHAGWPLYAGPREVWRVCGYRESGQREIFLQDPDGYLIMVAEPIGERPLKTDKATLQK